jgi:uncharacterized protein (TIGR00255 family)
MTGFARSKRDIPEGEIAVSIKSVNHRGLDMHFHMPPELDPIETDLRALIKGQVARGHLQIHVSLTRPVAKAPAPLNRPLLDAYLRAFREAADVYGLSGTPDLNSALRMPGMLAAATETEDLAAGVTAAVLEAAAEALNNLRAAREREGEATLQDLRKHVLEIRKLVERMQEIRAGAVPAFQKRLREKLGDLLAASIIDPQRVAQEAAILADRSDISEELARLRTHASQLDQMLSAGGEVGKRLDFLLQEMNREANTVLSKTGGLGDLGLTITELALAAKSETDKIREQALNLE